MSILLKPNIFNFWIVACPVILSLASQSIMLFVDRLFLSQYSLQAMEAATAAGTLAFAFVFSFISIASISAVLVGKYNGSKEFHKVGRAVWQTIWFALLSTFFFHL